MRETEERITIQDMVYESFLLDKKCSNQTIRYALLKGDIKNAELEKRSNRLAWTASRQDFLDWLDKR